MKRVSILLLFLLILGADPGLGDTVRGTISAGNSAPTFRFYPQSSEKVELTLMWLKPAVNLDLLARCFDEIGSEFTTVYSESGHDRIERLEFGGWSGSVCTVQVYSVDSGVRTRFLLNLQTATEDSLERVAGSASANGKRIRLRRQAGGASSPRLPKKSE